MTLPLGRHRRRSSSVVMLLVALLWFAPSAMASNAVEDWSVITHQVSVVNAARAGLAQIDFAYVHLAIYDAVNAIDGRYTMFAVKPDTAPAGASMEAATAAAAHKMLVWLYPLQAANIDILYANYLLGITGSPAAKARGIAVGEEVATKFIALRTGDGRDAPSTYVFSPPGPGVYQPTPAPTPPGYTGPVGPWVANFKTFAIESSTQFRAPGPPQLNSAKWAQDYNETKAYGSAASTVRSPEQTAIGRFYSDNPGTQGNRNVRTAANAYGLSLADSARFYAQVYVSMADAQITTWHWKYHYNFWRPVTAIRAGATDGNDMTEGDLTWSPLVVTPQHPEYPGAHATVTGAFGYAVEQFFGTKHVNLTLTSTTAGAVPLQHFDSAKDLVQNVINGRIYGGMHYRTSSEDGGKIARAVAKYIAHHYFLKVGDTPTDDDDDPDDENEP